MGGVESQFPLEWIYLPPMFPCPKLKSNSKFYVNNVDFSIVFCF